MSYTSTIILTDRILEATSAEIVTNYDGPVSHRYVMNVRPWTLNPKTKIASFSARDSGPDGSGRPHIVNVQSVDHKHLMRDQDLTDEDKVELAYTDGELKVYCDCESFLYGGFQYITWVLQSGLRRELRKPVIRNPQEEGLCCKHIRATMEQFPKFMDKIADAYAGAKQNNYQVVDLS